MSLTLIYRSKIIISAYQGWIAKSSHVLDIGCGNAIVTEELRKHFRCFVTGTDILNYAKRKITFTPMSHYDKLPFHNKEFDIAMFNSALAHCQDCKEILTEALRVANEVLIFEAEPSLLLGVWDRFIGRFYHHEMNPQINIRTSAQWKLEFRGLNFEYHQVKTSWWYPFKHFVFRIKSNEKTENLLEELV